MHLLANTPRPARQCVRRPKEHPQGKRRASMTRKKIMMKKRRRKNDHRLLGKDDQTRKLSRPYITIYE